MKIDEVRQRAYALGMNGISRIKKGDLIRAVQQAEGNQPCFGTAGRLDCSQLDCCWREDCLVPRPG
ncbi:SAP domain-containing protein [Desulfuromonas carbonis]|uniref:hypothetical protein n=1 Tax=Desulfuromonas sp. DDH964 TaxID=1823759 RepID=UPI00078C1E59|nr:hypothetical protein [Desulfuromonas sp. DDH964]AMV70805.1 SAP domain-containing protein [Desulfuromonas sp. DDH964]